MKILNRKGVKTFKTVLATAFIALLAATEGLAGELSVHGFLQSNYSLNTDGSNPDGGDFKLAEERAQLKAEGLSEPFRLFIKTDVSYGHMDDKADAELREGYIDLTQEKWDLRLGRQIITWGLGDLIFINDVFPKDYGAFFSGRPMEYLKKGVDGVRFGLYPGFASFEVLVIPFFEPNNTPPSERFHLFDPMPGVTDRVRKQPPSNIKNTELAVRAYRDLAGFDASIYVYRGFFRNPSMMPDSISVPSRITLMYPELTVYGGSLQGTVFSGVLSLEAGYYGSREDRRGVNPFIPNSQTKFLLGYQRELFEDFTAGFQYLGEYMSKYPEYEDNIIAGFPKDPKFRDIISVRLTYLLMHQFMRLQWFSFWSPADEDYLINPEVKYNFSDHVWGALGGNVFGGWGGRKDSTQFGSIDKDDNIYLQLRYEL